MTKAYIPGQNVPISIGGTPVDPVWYDFFKFIETLQPLSDIVFPAAGVTSIDGATGAITISYPLSRSSQDLRAALTPSSAVLGSDVALNNIANYFDGPSISLAAGTWLVIGKVVVSATTIPTETYCKMWDGTNVFTSASTENVNATRPLTVTLAAVVTLVGTTTVKISCRNPNSTDGKIYFNQSGNSKDSDIVAVRIG